MSKVLAIGRPLVFSQARNGDALLLHRDQESQHRGGSIAAINEPVEVMVVVVVVVVVVALCYNAFLVAVVRESAFRAIEVGVAFFFRRAALDFRVDVARLALSAKTENGARFFDATASATRESVRRTVFENLLH